MADRGRVGTLVFSSKSCAQKVWQREHDAHRERLRRSRSAVDVAVPTTLGMDHLRRNLKGERLLEERYTEIDRDNQAMLKKISNNLRRPPTYEVKGMSNRPTSLNRTGRKRELQEITRENRRMLKAIQEVKPVYSAKRWDDSFRQSEVLLRNCSSHPILTRQLRAREPPAVLLRLDEPGATAGSSPIAAGADSIDDQQSYLLKEGRRIGGAYYLIEMSTDGRVLNISAFEGETQTTLELVVKEKVHRQLYRDFNGDYTEIANRLSVNNGSLTLDVAGASSPTPSP